MPVRYHSLGGRPNMQSAGDASDLKCRVPYYHVLYKATRSVTTLGRDLDHNFSLIVSGIHLDSMPLTNLFVCSAKVKVNIVWGRIRARWAKYPL